MKQPLLLLCFSASLVAAVQAATVDHVSHRASAGGSRLKTGASVGAGSAVVTGEKSKLQLSVGSQGSVIRAGSQTDATLGANEKSLSLKSGLVLASSGNSTFGREEMNVDTPEAKNSVRGTMMISYKPRSHMKVVCIEGTARVRLKSSFTQFVALKAGQMVIINPAEKSVPEPVEVDIAQLATTSTLLSGDFPALPSNARLQNSIALQAKALDGGQLADTNLTVNGLTVGVDQGIEALRQLDEEAPEPAAPAPDRPPEEEEHGVPGPSLQTFVINDTTVFDIANQTITTPGIGTVQGSFGNYNFPAGTDFTTVLQEGLRIVGNVTIPAESGGSVDYVVWGGMTIGSPTGSTVLNIQPGFSSVPDRLTIQNATVNASGGFSVTADGLADYGPAGDIPPHIVVSNSHVAAQGPLSLSTHDASFDHPYEPGVIDVSNSVLSSVASNVTLTTQDPNSTIAIRNSSQLRALGSLGDINIQLLGGGHIDISNSSLQASNEILIDAAPASSAAGTINLTNVLANADVIRARAFSPSGDALIINGGTYNAASLLKFYAEGGGALRFIGNVNVNSPDISFAGTTVNVDAGSTVTTSSISKVFAGDGNSGNGHNYNTSGRGTISPTPSQGAYNSRPSF